MIVEDMVIYLVKNNKSVPYGAQGMIVATSKENSDNWPLRSDEVMVDFGSEDSHIIRTKSRCLQIK